MNYICTLKKITAAILLIIFSVQFAYAAVVIVWYYANRDYVAKELCINKERPQMACNGKCFLNKKLKETDSNQDNHALEHIKKLIEITPYIISKIKELPKIPVIKSPNQGVLSNNYQFTLYEDIFHPPSVNFS